MKSIGLFLAVLAACFLEACSASEARRDPRLQSYRLTVTFPSGAVIRTSASPMSTFGGTTVERNGGNAYAIGGTVSPTEGAAVPILITVVQTKLEAAQNGIVAFTFKTEVPLGQPTSVGASPGICTVQLDP